MHDTKCEAEKARGLIVLTIKLTKPDFEICCQFYKLYRFIHKFPFNSHSLQAKSIFMRAYIELKIWNKDVVHKSEKSQYVKDDFCQNYSSVKINSMFGLVL